MNDPAWTGSPCGRLEYKRWRSAVSDGRKRRETLRPSIAPRRLSIALMNLLHWRGCAPLRKIGRVLNFHAVLGLHALEPFLILCLSHNLRKLDTRILERLLVDLLGTNQVKTVGLLDRRAHFSLLQSEDRGYERGGVAAIRFDHAEIAICSGGRLVVGNVVRQLAKIGAGLKLFCQILDLGLRFRF